MPKHLYLLYHELHREPGGYTYALATDAFSRHLALWSRLRVQNGSLQPEITFDDGHCSNLTEALPALNRHGLTAHFFITAGWTGTRAGFMDWPELRTLAAAGQRIGAHGMTHKLLTHCTVAELRHELEDARSRLEDGLGQTVTALSLPGGRGNRNVLAACREAGYSTVFTSEPKAENDSAIRIGRLNIRSTMELAWLEELFRPESPTLRKLGRQYRAKQALQTALGDQLYARLWSLLNRQDAMAREAEAATSSLPQSQP